MKRNAKGYRIGEDHHRAKLTDAQVEEIRVLRDEGWSYGQISKRMSASYWTVRDIADYRTR